MIKKSKKKSKRNAPSDIPIVWVNIIEPYF